jgi:hypothetical protein
MGDPFVELGLSKGEGGKQLLYEEWGQGEPGPQFAANGPVIYCAKMPNRNFMIAR